MNVGVFVCEREAPEAYFLDLFFLQDLLTVSTSHRTHTEELCEVYHKMHSRDPRVTISHRPAMALRGTVTEYRKI